MATPREILKYYFRKHALPTEKQFAELIDAFVHKDEDTITQEKIDGLINALAGKMSSETFEAFKTEIQETVTNNGNDLSALTERVTTAEGNITTLRDDVDTNTDHISGLNQRVEALEKEQPAQVTGNFLKQIADLDSYEGTEGEIVQYIGATNEEYRRGFCYERKAGEVVVETEILQLSHMVNYRGSGYPKTDVLRKTNEVCTIHRGLSKYFMPPVQVGSSVCCEIFSAPNCKITTVTNIDDNYIYVNNDSIQKSSVTEEQYVVYKDLDGKKYVRAYSSGQNQEYLLAISEDGNDFIGILAANVSENTVSEESTSSSWQVIPTSPCVN